MDGKGGVLDSIQAELGILKISNNPFEVVFEEQLAKWFRSYGRIPAIASGMIGSRQGWCEAPYIECPAGPEELAEQLSSVTTSSGITLAIVPGMNHWEDGIPDVMRGEETQIAGVMQEYTENRLYVLPGTHSKWVSVREKKIEGFRTFMSGELFSVLVEHSILGHLMQGREIYEDAFERGCLQSLEKESGLLHQLFTSRTLGLFDKVPGVEIHSFLSGLIIGEELREGLGVNAKMDVSVDHLVMLIGEAQLIRLYQHAFRLSGINAEIVEGNPVTRGLYQIAKAASLVN